VTFHDLKTRASLQVRADRTDDQELLDKQFTQPGIVVTPDSLVGARVSPRETKALWLELLRVAPKDSRYSLYMQIRTRAVARSQISCCSMPPRSIPGNKRL
jgi:hypothetical protein